MPEGPGAIVKSRPLGSGRGLRERNRVVWGRKGPQRKALEGRKTPHAGPGCRKGSHGGGRTGWQGPGHRVLKGRTTQPHLLKDWQYRQERLKNPMQNAYPEEKSRKRMSEKNSF